MHDEGTQPVDRATIERLLELSHLVRSSGLAAEEEPRPLRFGEVAAALGFVTREQVDTALRVQRRDRETGRLHRRVGQVLVELGALEPSERVEVVDALVDLARAQRARPVAGRELPDERLLVDGLDRCA